MTALSTTVDADPAALRAVATWLGSSLGTAVDSTDTALRYARADRGEWDGLAGDAFRSRMGQIATMATGTGAAARTAAAGVNAFASAVDAALVDVDALRSAAAGARLSLTPTSILAPPAAPPRPQHPGPLATAADLRAYANATTARAAAIGLLDAYEVASATMGAVLGRLATASATLDAVQAEVQTVTVPAIDFASGAFISAKVEQGIAALRGQSRWLLDSADTLEARAALPGAAQYPTSMYGDLDEAARLRAQALTAVDDASRLARAGRAAGAVAGVVLTGVSIYSDIEAGESTEQAVASNVAGLGASIAAGAATGAILGTVVPGLGNVAGAVIGAAVGGVVGIFTSGVVDGFFEQGPDVMGALSNGVNDVAETGEAIGGLAVAAADGLSDAWGSLFG